jgi:hypothetical protein
VGQAATQVQELKCLNIDLSEQAMQSEAVGPTHQLSQEEWQSIKILKLGPKLVPHSKV